MFLKQFLLSSCKKKIIIIKRKHLAKSDFFGTSLLTLVLQQTRSFKQAQIKYMFLLVWPNVIKAVVNKITVYYLPNN